MSFYCFIPLIESHTKKLNIISSLLIVGNVGKSAHRHLSAVTQLLLSRGRIFRISFNEMHVVDGMMRNWQREEFREPIKSANLPA